MIDGYRVLKSEHLKAPAKCLKGRNRTDGAPSSFRRQGMTISQVGSWDRVDKCRVIKVTGHQR